jgi:hypothetical protein
LSDPKKIRTIQASVYGKKATAVVVEHLIAHGQWCSVTPMPDNQWSIEVKEENAELLKKLVPAPIGYYVVLFSDDDLGSTDDIGWSDMTTHHNVSAYDVRHALMLACENRHTAMWNSLAHTEPDLIPHLMQNDDASFYAVILDTSTMTTVYEGGKHGL